MIFLASVCPCPPWFPNGTMTGTYNWTEEAQLPPFCTANDPREKYYGIAIEYQCPYGYVFDLDPDEYNETDTLILKCEAWADWDPPIQPTCRRNTTTYFKI